MKLKELLAEGFDDEAICYGCGREDGHDGPCLDPEECDPETCPGCGRGPGDGYGEDCDHPEGCGYWKDWAREAVAELRGDMKRDGGMEESTYFDDYMAETLHLEARRAKQLKAAPIEESIGKKRQKLVQELPQNRIKIGG